MKSIVSLLLCAALGVATPYIAFAQDEGSGQFADLTREAAQAYDNGEYDKAVKLFKQAYDLRNVSNILYNIGRIYEDAGNIDGAIEYYDLFVVAPNVEQTSRKDALERLKTLREVKKLQDGGEETQVAEQTPQPAPQPAPEPEPEPNTGRTVGWVFLGVGGASLIGSGIFALLTQSQFDKFEGATALQDRREAARAGKTNAVVADALLATGAVSAIVGGVFLIASSGSGAEKDPSAVRLSPMVGNAWGLGLDWNF